MSNGKTKFNRNNKNSGKPKSSKYNSRGRKGNATDGDYKFNKASQGDINDASYYFTDNVVMNQLTNISFNEFLGVPLDVGDLVADAAEEGRVSIPSFMQIRLNPSAGGNDPIYGNGNLNGLNTAAKQLFLKLSAGNMKSTEYGPEDVALAVLGIGSILEVYSYIKRVFGTHRLFNQRNRTIPKLLLGTMNVNADDFMHNIATYRARFNYLITLANQIPFPANIPYFHKCVDLYTNLYLDNPESPLSQIYIMMPDSYWKFDDTYSDAGSGLRTGYYQFDRSDGGPVGMKMSDILDKFEEQILAMVNSTALLKVYSDVLRLADKEGLARLSIATIPDDYAILPVYNAEFMSMLKNATIIGSPLNSSYPFLPDGETVWDEDYSPTSGNDVVGDAASSTVKYRPPFPSASKMNYGVPERLVLNMQTQNYSAADIVEATRFMAMPIKWYMPQDGSAPSQFTTYSTLPDHYITGITIYDSANDTYVNIYNNVAVDGDTSDVFNGHKLAILSQFSVHPFIYGISKVSDNEGNVTGNTFLFGDTGFYTTVDYDYLHKINDFAMLGLFTLR